MAAYGFTGKTIDDVAQTLQAALGVTFYAHQSPMIGPWYSDTDLGAIIQAMRVGKPVDPNPGGRYELVLNDPEPGYTAPEFLGGHPYVLRFTGNADEQAALEAKLRQAGIKFAVLKR